MTNKESHTSFSDSALAMVGNTYGSMLVLDVRLDSKYGKPRWFAVVRCTRCGAEYMRLAYQVRQKSNVGCGKCAKRRHYVAPYKDLSGQIFNSLKVLHIVGDYIGSAHTVWACACLDCGAEKNVEQYRLGVYKTCGCKRDAEQAKGSEINRAMCIGGTSISAIAPSRAVNKNSKTGVTGVNLTKNGRYRATIVFKRKQYGLGEFDSLEEAASARKAAEKSIYGDFLEKYYAGDFGTPHIKKQTK